MAVIPRTVALVANGMVCSYPFIKQQLMSYEKLIAVDGGLCHCHTMGVTPDLLVGDLDSVPEQLLSFYPDMEIRRFPELKDETDLELGVRIADTSDTKRITLFSALGGRTDHTLANLSLLLHYPEYLYIETEKEITFAIQGKTTIASIPGQTISLIPLGRLAEGITTRGLKWELNHSTLNYTFMSISNVCLDTSFDVTILNGGLICCMQKPYPNWQVSPLSL